MLIKSTDCHFVQVWGIFVQTCYHGSYLFLDNIEKFYESALLWIYKGTIFKFKIHMKIVAADEQNFL